MTYLTMKIEDIIKWCQENNQVEWLKKEAAKKVEVKVYPKVKNEKGKMVQDKTQAPIGTKEVNIPYVELKNNFVNKFMPELAPKANAKKPSMYDMIANL